MTIAVKLLNDQIKKISETNTLLDMLLEFEKTLDGMDLYAFKNWDEGEVLEGPTLDRHYMTVKLMYPKAQMPDPSGAQRLLKRDVLVKYNEDTLIKPRKVRNFDDLAVETRADGGTRFRTKTDSHPVWVVELKMPRKYVDEFNADVVEMDEDSYVDVEDAGTDAQLQAEEPAVDPIAAPPVDPGAGI